MKQEVMVQKQQKVELILFKALIKKQITGKNTHYWKQKEKHDWRCNKYMYF